MWRLLACLVIFSLFPLSVHAAVILNEISPRTDPEWIELYNTGPDAVNLTDWYYLDAASNKKVITAPEPLNPNTYFLSTPYSSWLNNDGDTLYLYDNLGNLVDSVQFVETKPDTSVARIPDFTGSWLLNQSPTALAANVTPTPSATPIPSPSPSPTPSTLPSAAATAQSPPTPIPTSTPTSTPTPANSPRSRIVAQPSLSPILPQDGSAATIAGVTDIDLSGYGIAPPPSPSPLNPDKSALSLNRPRLKFLITSLSGILLLGLAGYLAYLQKKRQTSSPEL